MSKKSPDTSAADSESDLMQKEYDENQQEIAEKRKQIDDQEMAYLHSEGGLSYDNPVIPAGGGGRHGPKGVSDSVS